MRQRFFALLIATIAVSQWHSAMADGDDSSELDAVNVYQRIKDADDNGLTVKRFVEGMSQDAADLILDEQGAATGGEGNDSAPRPLVRRVNDSKLQSATYDALRKMHDNYSLREGDPEEYTDEEKQEIKHFLDAIMATRPMKIAYAYTTDGLGRPASPDEFRELVERMWFDLYSNHFGGHEAKDCSGFEHVFVGEGKFAPSGPAPRRGQTDGYHCWVKFLDDERDGRINYVGHLYGLSGSNRPTNPPAITLRSISEFDPDGDDPQTTVRLVKKKGGFFVGLSPECQVAMGTVAKLEHDKGLLNNDKRRTVIDGVTLDLVLYPEIKSNGKSGERIRSFYPVVVGPAQPIDTPTPHETAGPVKIIRALPNPEGEDETGEWVELKNVSSSDITLADWELRDKQGGSRALEGVIAAGETRRIDNPRTGSSTLQLGNNGGEIRLVANGTQVDLARYGRANSEQVFVFEE